MDPKDDQIYLKKVGRDGWTVIGRSPEQESVSTVDENNRTVTTKRPTGNIEWVITDGKGHNQTMTVSGSIPAANADSIVKPPADQPKEPSTASAPADWNRLDANGKVIPKTDTTTQAVYLQDPKAPPGTAPFKIERGQELGDPTTWTPIYRTPGDASSGIVGQYDPKSQKVAASVTAAPNATPSGTFTNVVDPNDPTGKRVIGLIDTGDKSLHAVSTQADGKQIVTTSQGIYSYDKDTDTTKLLQALDPKSPIQIITYPDGTIFSFDPNETPDKRLTKIQGQHPPQTITSNGTTYTLKADGTGYELPPGVSRPTTVDNSTTLKRIVIRDDQGKVLSDTPNVNYVAPTATVPTPNTTAPQIQVPDPNDPSKLIWIENKGRVTASEALRQLASHLSGQVVSGDISVDEAKSIIDASNAKMTADTNQLNAVAGAAGSVITGTNAAAQTGAGLLQNRVTNAMSGLNTAISAIGNSKMTSAPAGMGANLVGGLQEWVTQLGGGQPVYDSAAAMVNAANPTVSGNPTVAQQAYSMLRGAMDLYKQKTGTDYVPPDQRDKGFTAPTTADAGTVGGGATPVQTNVSVQQPNAAATAANLASSGGSAFNPQSSTATLNARGLVDTPQGRAMAAGQTPVASVPPVYPGQYNTAYQQGVIQPAGMPATGPVVGAIRPNPMLPIPGYSPYGPFQAPVTV